MITFNSNFQTDLLENDAANRDESFIAVKYDEAVGEPTAEVEQSAETFVEVVPVLAGTLTETAPAV